MAVIGREYTNDIADQSAAYPTSVMVADNVRDHRSTYSISGEVTAPALRGGYSRWRVPMAISEGSLSITLSAVAQELVPYGQVPVAGQVGVSYSGGILDFPAANVGEEFAVSFTGRGTPITGELLNRIQLELIANQTKTDELIVGAGFVLPIGGVDGQALTSDGADGADWTTLGGAALLSVGTTAGTVAAGDDSRFHDAVTLAGTPNYLTISGQEITLAAVDLTTDVTGTLPVANGGTGATTASAARTALGLAIGLNVQAYSANLSTIGATSPGVTGLALLDDVSAADARDTIDAAHSRPDQVAVSATRDIATTDEDKLLVVTGATTLTVPNSLPTGFQCGIMRDDASNSTTIAAEGTLKSRGTVLAEQYAACWIYKEDGTNVRAIGELSTP